MESKTGDFMSQIGVAIIGGTGMGAGELLRLLLSHENAEVVSVASRSSAGKPLVSAHPHLNGLYDLNFDEAVNWCLLADYSQRVIFSTLPHKVSSKVIAELHPKCVSENVKLIDFSGDFRIQNPDLHRKYYPEVDPEIALRRQFVFGLPEINRTKLREASFTANPGCLASAAILSLLPLVPHEIKQTIAVNAVTGSSGAGRELRATTHHPIRRSNMFAYSAMSHRHQGEILESLETCAGSKPEISFVTHSTPLSRGIYVTSYATLEKSVSKNAVCDWYQEFYKGHPFIRLVERAEVANVVGSNFCDISIYAEGSKVVACAALDNLIKGMSGQAIQNMNLMFGLTEEAGLRAGGLRAV
jgi:LysW-gamma-L-alpha-aminoadipyl-6-phosphate/LysW-L-glutamyl-5-phosphate reductase